MSEGKKFTKTDSNLSPEQRLEEIERKYEVIRERIQAYDKVLEEFSLLKVDMKNHGQLLDKQADSLEKLDFYTQQKTGAINSKLMALGNGYESVKSDVHNQKSMAENLATSLQEACGKFYRDIEMLKIRVHNVEMQSESTHSSSGNFHNDLTQVKKSVELFNDKMVNHTAGFLGLEQKLKDLQQTTKVQIDSLINSFQNLPQFNEWATKIYIRVCNEISDRQKEFYHELDKRSQQLTKELASDPYTAESVKRMLREEMDTMAMDGRNAYLKATNAAQQMQLLEKKVENINLILKKYELNK